ncbi:MAG: DNA repair protein RecO [Candidatus Wildermuthbacteria bacterium]|nr:DNA repair protein RecO [Candidatus Wildermuthbacteria bacterium]
MSIRYRTQGIVLAHTDRGEADRVFTVFTRDFGKLALWGISARSIRSKLRGNMETLAHADIEFVQGKAKKTLTDAVAHSSYPSLRKNLKKLRTALRIAETFRQLVRGEEQDEALWNLLSVALHELELLEDDASFSLFYFSFFWRLMSALGYRPSIFAADPAFRIASVLATLPYREALNAVPHDAKLHATALRKLAKEYISQLTA